MTENEASSPDQYRGRDEIATAARQSQETMSRAVSEWLCDANPAQAEAIRLLSDCFDRDIEMISELANCENPQDVFGLHRTVAGNLVSDYMAEGSRIVALHREAG